MRIDVEWFDAPGVKDAVHAKTWCRLQISLPTGVPTRFSSAVSGSERDAVFGSAFPLCRWIVSNWWALLHEGVPADPIRRGARATRNRTNDFDDWFDRHSLLAAREGYALPDLLIYRDEAELEFIWFEDPLPTGDHARGRFVSRGQARVPADAAERALARFVDAVLDRLDGSSEEEVSDLRSDWDATRAADREAALSFRTAGSIGLDPFAIDDGVFDRVARVALELECIPAETRSDILACSTIDSLDSNSAWVAAAVLDVGPCLSPQRWNELLADRSRAPHAVGYAWAHAIRGKLSLDNASAIDDVEALFNQLGTPLVIDETPRLPKMSVDAFAATAGAELRVRTTQRSTQARRFLVARVLALTLTSQTGSAARLVTRAFDWRQRASRAFAAELLAPASALRCEVDRAGDDLSISELSDHFQVDARVILHQIENHEIDVGW